MVVVGQDPPYCMDLPLRQGAWLRHTPCLNGRGRLKKQHPPIPNLP